MNKKTIMIAAAALIATSGLAFARPIHSEAHVRARRAETYLSFRDSYNSYAPHGSISAPAGSLAYREFHHLFTGDIDG
jgi:hypothetical protein